MRLPAIASRTPAVSVVMTAYNAQPFMAEALESVLGQTLAAFMIFVMVFSLVASLVFLVLSWLALETGLAPVPSHPLGALVFLALVIPPAFLVARWQIRRPPLERPLPK
jgi:hypothetical protein